jgi:hypothetical protein
MKIYRTTQYRGDIPWGTRLCTSRRQWAQLKKDFGYFGITRMELESFEIPEHLWITDQQLPEVKKIEQVQNNGHSVDEIREKLDLPPWALGEPGVPVFRGQQGPIPFSMAPEIIKMLQEGKDET